jgi:hypothetical protein
MEGMRRKIWKKGNVMKGKMDRVSRWGYFPI